MEKANLSRLRPWAYVAGAALFGGTFAGTAAAQPAADNGWRSSVTVYAYLPSVRGDTIFPGGSAGPSFKIDAHDILSGLNLAAMGALQFQKGRWGGLVDVFYADVSEHRRGSRNFTVSQIPVPVGVRADLGLDNRTALVTLAGTWQFVAEPNRSVRLVVGTRMNHDRQRLDWQLSAPLIGYPEVSGRSTTGHTRWDAIIGISGRQKFGTDLRWYVPFYVDAGTGGSRFTGQALAGIGYAFDWGEVTAAWRYIDYDFKSSSLIRRTAYSGPAVGLTWRF